MARLSLREIKKSFATFEALRGIDLEIEDKELMVFVGPSGCGKSTLLRLIAGLDKITEGEFYIDDQEITRVSPSKRGIAMVFQSYALYPHMNIYDNMAFGIRLMGLPKSEVEARITEAAAMLKLEPLLDRKPRELSGGQRQRVAIGRAIVRKPSVFLLDEPLSNLDASLRSDVRLEIAKLHKEIGGTTIYVTHDQVEAMTLADRIVVMNGGLIEQVGTPRELYESPNNTFVATFIGSPKMTLLETLRDGDKFSIEGSGFITMPTAPKSAEKVTLGVRPNVLELRSSGEGFTAKVEYSEYLGNDAYSYVRLMNGHLICVAIDPNEMSYVAGDEVLLRFKDEAVLYFDTATGDRISR